MKDYAAKAMELAPRDIVARAIQKEIDAGRGFENQYVHLDLTHLGAEKINERLPGIRQIAMDFAGVDPIKEPIPIQPGQHYSMGGIAADNDCATELPGLFAAGECSCISVHGANRLGGNSLLETVVFGKIAGSAMVNYITGSAPNANIKDAVMTEVAKEDERLNALLSRTSGEKASAIRDELRKVMFEDFGVFRTESKMKEGLHQVNKLQERYSRVYFESKAQSFNQTLIHVIQLGWMLKLAEAVGLGAIARRESRGSHSRTDYPSRNDEDFLNHSMVYQREDGLQLEYSDVRLGLFPVKERVY